MKISTTATLYATEFAPILLRGKLPQLFQTTAELGYDGIELHLRRPEDVQAEEVLGLMQRHSLAVPTIGTGMAAGMDGLNFASDDAAVREAAVAIIGRHIELAARLGAGVTLGLIVGRLGAEAAQRERRYDHLLTCLRCCAERAERAGVTLFLEAINRYEGDALNTLADAAAAARRVGSPRIRLLADTFHMNIEEVDIAGTLETAGDLLGHVHLVDSNRWAPGYGHVDFTPVLAALKRIGFGGFLSFEILARPDPLQAARQGLANVRSLLDRGAA